MVALFYRSVSDGWRVGVTDAINLAKVVVTDVETGQQETVLPNDVFLIEEQYSRSGEIGPLLRMQDYPEIFVEQHDAATMVPSPIVGVPALVQLLRYRASEDICATCIGDNFSLLVGEGNPLDINEPGSDTAEKAVAAWKASKTQQIIASAGRAKAQLRYDIVDACAEHLDAVLPHRRELRAAFQVLSAMTSLVSQRDCAVGCVHMFADPASLVYTSARVEHYMLNLDTISDTPCPFSFKVFAFIIYGFSGDERERVFINRKQEDFVCQTALTDADLIAKVRLEYGAFTKAMDTLGITFSSQLAFFTRIAAVIHLLEVDFYEDGSPSNIPALKNVAKLLQLDFNDCLRVLPNRQTCVAAARLLYRASFAALCRRVNSVLDPNPDNTEPAITLLTVPALPPTTDDNLRGVMLATLYEDLVQCFFRSSDEELLQWQRAGFTPSPQLQAAFDTMDNFSLLKVLRGLGGVLATAQSRGSLEQRKLALASCAKHAKVQFDSMSGIVTVQHTFGPRQYQFPKTPEDIAMYNSLNHASFEDMKELLVENADVDTQEALYLLDQDSNHHDDHIITEDLDDCQRVLAVMQNDKAGFWWIGSVELGAEFNGDFVEEQLKELPVKFVVQLRQLLPKRYVSCQPGYVVQHFSKLLQHGSPLAVAATKILADRAARRRDAEAEGNQADDGAQSPREPASPVQAKEGETTDEKPKEEEEKAPAKQEAQKAPAAAVTPAGEEEHDGVTLQDIAEAILSAANVEYHVTPETILTEAKSIISLKIQLKKKVKDAAILTQAFCRTKWCGIVLSRRITTWVDAIRKLKERQELIVATHKHITQNAEYNKTHIIGLLEEEAAARAIIKEEYWTEWTPMQLQAQQEIEVAMARAVASSLKNEEKRIRRTMRLTHRNVSRQLEDQIQERLQQHAAHLDSVVEQTLNNTSLSLKHAERVQEAHDRLMRNKAELERTRKQVAVSIEEKEARVLRVQKEKQRLLDERRDQNWLRQAKDRATKERINKIQNEVNRNLEVQIVLQDIESQMTQRVQTEISTHQRHQNNLLQQQLKEERRVREERMVRIAKANERMLVRKEREAEQQREAERKKALMLERREHAAMERERCVAERLRAAEEKQEKETARALLKAQASLNKPRVYEHRLRGASIRRSSEDRPLGQSFTTVSGKETHPRMLSEATIRGLVAFHNERRRSSSPNGFSSLTASRITPPRKLRHPSP